MAAAIITDGGFENWESATNLASWSETVATTSSVNREETVKHSGAYSVLLSIDGLNNRAYINQDVTLVASKKYVLSIWYKTESGKTCAIRFKDPSNNIRLNNLGAWVADDGLGIVLPSSTTMIKYSIVFRAHASYTLYRLYVGHHDAWGSSSASASIYVDDFSITPPKGFFVF